MNMQLVYQIMRLHESLLKMQQQEKGKSLRKSENNTIHSPIKIGIKKLQLAAIFQYYTCNC